MSTDVRDAAMLTTTNEDLSLRSHSNSGILVATGLISRDG